MSAIGQLEAMAIYKSVIPQYLLASQKLDFLCFTEGMYKLVATYLPGVHAEDMALWWLPYIFLVGTCSNACAHAARNCNAGSTRKNEERCVIPEYVLAGWQTLAII